MFWAISGIVVGLILLVWGGEWLVRGAERLALTLRISPLVIGLTVVAFGTSAPELAVTVQSAVLETEVGIGNVIGSNIFNVLFILGISAIVAPLVVSQDLIRRDVPIMIACSALVYWACWDGVWSRLNGGLAFLGLMIYTWYIVVASRRATATDVGESPANQTLRPRYAIFQNLMLAVVGLGLLVLGANWLVDGAVFIARALQVSELVIGLTIVAAGTSLPEVMTSVIASFRGQREIAVGNIVGSNIFNLLCVMGLAGLVSPKPLTISTAALQFDFPVMLVVAVACLPIFLTGRIARWEGLVFLLYYVVYVVYMIVDQTGHAAKSSFEWLFFLFIIPLSVITLIVSFAVTPKLSRDSSR